MEIFECEKKHIKISCTNGNIVSGFCIEYLSAEDADDERACVYIAKGEHACIEVFEGEIVSIEQLN